MENLGKGIFWWRTHVTANGDPLVNARLLKDAGFQWVAVKVVDGNEPYTAPNRPKPNVTREFRSVFTGRVYGWEFVTHAGALKPQAVLANQVQLLDLDGGIFDVEGDFDLADGAETLARTIVTRYRNSTSKPLGWCSWALFRNPKTGGGWHPANVASAGMEGADFGVPMAYWPGSVPAEVALYAAEVIRQWRTLVSAKPLVLTGRAYTGDGGVASPATLAAFDDRVRAQDVASYSAGICWWSYQHAYPIATTWAALKAMPQWAVTPPPQPPLPPGVALREWAAAVTLHLRKSGYNGPDLAPE